MGVGTVIANPHKGMTVQIWYGKRRTPFPAHQMPLHGKIGTVQIVSRGKPRNHGVMVDGVVWCIPCGNLRKVQP